MNTLRFFVLLLFLGIVIGCGGSGNKTDENMVIIKTEFGDIKVKLYNDTPKHRDNFIKLVDEGFYTDILFHRVIKQFMIQGGDPTSKDAAPGVQLGGGSPGYTIPAEILPNHHHKKGALAAARLGGPKNPMKESSGSQFYIVQGLVYRPGQLDTLEMKINAQRKDQLLRESFDQNKAKFNELQSKNDKAGFDLLVAQLREKADSLYATKSPFKLTPEQRNDYTTIGGYPSLDNEYTVFGEVVEGLDVIDKIAVVETDRMNRPVKDVKMKVEQVK
jgi:cyclophilin family peptidyl-prolyl cis-trans isomerase